MTTTKLNTTKAQTVGRQDRMSYDEVTKHAEALSYRDKLRLAQLLIQIARKEEEEQHPQERKSPGNSSTFGGDTLQYVATRIKKLRPNNKTSLINSIDAMFQFQGGISDSDRERIVLELQRERIVVINPNGRVTYPE